METEVKVGDLMTRDFVHAPPNTTLQKCAEALVKKRVGSLIIMEENKLKGILTEKDIVYAVVKKSKKDLSEILAEDLMNRKVITTSPKTDIIEALRRMKKYKVRRLPVIENNEVIGMLTLKDILKVDPGLFEVIAEIVSIKEESKKLKFADNVKSRRKDGICEECGNRELLLFEDGEWICTSCYELK